MRRVVAVLAIWSSIGAPALAQDRPGLPVIGILRIDTPTTVGPSVGMFRDALAALGDVDGKNVRLDARLAEGDPGRFPELAAALVRDNPKVIVAGGPAAARAAQAATRTIPIVASTNDLVADGLIASLAKPGGNLTGVSLLITELDAKRLEVLKEIIPAGRRFGVLNDPAVSGPPGLQVIADTARTLGVELLWNDVHGPAGIPPAFGDASRRRCPRRRRPFLAVIQRLPRPAWRVASRAQTTGHLRMAGDDSCWVPGELRHDAAGVIWDARGIER
jgi:ABC-type uncharacterized transport system substrate-binding protein